MIRKLSTSDPYKSLGKDLYSMGIFDKTINGLLSVIEKNDNDRTILIGKKFANNSGEYISSGYYFIQCLSSWCNEDNLKLFRGFLEAVVIQKAKGNYMEVDPILIAPEYNRIQKRKPIQLFGCGE